MAARRHSRQRELIKEFLKTRKDHPTADIVYRNIRNQNPSISLGTVYRNLTLLAEAGEITRFNVGDGMDHFDGDVSPHYHFVCQECGRVMDLEMESIEEITDIAAAGFRGHIAGHMTYFYGICGDCIDRRAALGAEEQARGTSCGGMAAVET